MLEASVFMAIPIGTTSRQLGALVRWMYLAMTVTGLLSWWWPSYLAWSALMGGLTVAMLLWLCWQTVTINRTIPGHPIYWVLLLPGAVLTYHLARTGLVARSDYAGSLAGSLNLSMLLHLGLLAIAVVLSQSLLPRAISHTGVASICGAAMMGGGILAGLWEDAGPVEIPMSLVGFGGVAVWLSPLWRPTIPSSPVGPGPPPERLELRISCLIVAVAAGGLLAWNCPGAAMLAAVGAGLVLVFAAAISARRSRRMLVSGAVLVVGGGLAAAVWAPGLGELLPRGGPLLGLGEEAFGQVLAEGERKVSAVSAADSGLYILVRTVGLPVALLTAAGLLVCLATFLLRARRDHAGDRAQSVAWTVASALSATALFAPGGLFIPAVVLAIALTWGLTAGAAGRSATPRPGVLVLVGLVALIALMGVSRGNGLITWAANSFWPGQSSDKLIHAIFGLVLAMTLAWLMGARKLLWGLAAIVLGALAGGAGEVIQYVTVTRRGVEWGDWGAHAVGSILAVIPYLLCVGARLCESPDARDRQDPSGEGYLI